MDDTVQQAERDKVVSELYRDSFFHVAKCVQNDLVLPDIQPKFPDLEGEEEQSFSKDRKYIDFKKKREELMIRWGQHIDQVKKANIKVHECEEILDRIWKIRKEYKLYSKSTDTLTDEEQKKIFKDHLKVLIKLEQLLKSSNLDQGDKKKQKSQIGAGQPQPATNEDIKETGQSSELDVPPTDHTDSDNDDIQTADNSKQRQNKIHVEGSSQKDETESIDSGLDETKSSKSFTQNKEEKDSEQPMDTSEKDLDVVKPEDYEKLQKDYEKLKTKQKEKKNLAKTTKRDHDNRIKEIEEMSITIGELEKSNQDLEDQIKSFQSKNVSIKKVETQLKEAEDKIQTLIEENDRIQAKYKSFKDLEEQIIEATDLSQSLAEENERISELLKLPEEKTKMKVTTLQKKVKEERKHKEDLQQQLQEQKKKADDLSQMYDKYKAAYQKTKQTQDERLAMQRPQTAPSKQYREMQVMVETLKDEKESLMQRLSKVAGMKMKDNNPAIADLSDPNRPEKLSEKFREIYDNAWTNLLDTITEKTGESDDIGVKQIVSALMMMYDTCKNTITNNKREIAKLVGYSEDCFDKPYAGGKEGHDPVLKTLKDLIQVSVTRQMVAVTKNIKEFPEIKTILQVGGKNGEAFITECLQLCLYMCTQDPPVVLDFSCKSGDAFNKDKFTPFTKSGSVVDYMVWPVMYLSDNGAIMSKGIAQGK